MKIIGKQGVDYVSRKTNKQVTGMTLHCVGTSPNVEGEAVDTVYISSASPLYQSIVQMPIGTEIQLFYNRYGSVESIVPLSKEGGK